MAQATDTKGKALLVAFGSPSDPEPQERAMRGLAREVEALLPGWTVASATLAKPGSFREAAEVLGDPVVYPFFMADGFILDRMLMPRARKAGLQVMRPFGLEARLVDHAADAVAGVLADKAIEPSDATLVVAAHGSALSAASPDSALAFAEALRGRLGLKESVCGFLEQAPSIADAAKGRDPAICLTFFNLKAGHVLADLPAALAAAGFAGPVIDAFIAWPQTPRIIAESLSAWAGRRVGNPVETEQGRRSA